jgi:hypothetical protein
VAKIQENQMEGKFSLPLPKVVLESRVEGRKKKIEMSTEHTIVRPFPELLDRVINIL